jgi:hypothetical protein
MYWLPAGDMTGRLAGPESASARSVAKSERRNFLLNRDVVTLAEAGFPERIIIDTILTTSRT